MQFRDLTENDIPQLLKWLRQFSDSFDYPGKGQINDEVASLFFSRFINHEGNACIVAESENKPVAVIGFTMMPHPWTGETILFKTFWYSAKPGAGIALMKYVIDLCKRANVKQVIAGSMLPNSHRILRHMGFEPCETNYVLDLRN